MAGKIVDSEINEFIDLLLADIDDLLELEHRKNQQVTDHCCVKNVIFKLKLIICLIKKIIKSDKFGLDEIKKEIDNIEKKLDGNKKSLVSKIKKEVNFIEQKLDGTKDSLITEIKEEIIAIEEKLDEMVPVGGILTTGPVVKEVNNNAVIAKILNNTPDTVTDLTINIYDITDCNKQGGPVITEEVSLDTKCSAEFTFTKQDFPGNDVPDQYEVEYTGIEPGIYVFTSARTAAGMGQPANLLPANTFRHAEHVPQVDP